MSTLYLDRKDLKVSLQSQHLRLRTDDGRSTTVPTRLLQRVVVKGRVNLDSSIIARLAEQGVAMTFLGGRSHRRRAIMLGQGGQDASRRLMQYRALHTPALKVAIGRDFLEAKLAATLAGLATMLDQRPDQRHAITRAQRTVASMKSSLPVGDCDTMPVVLQPDNLGFSWSVSVQGKARLAVNGPSPLQEPERSHGR